MAKDRITGTESRKPLGRDDEPENRSRPSGEPVRASEIMTRDVKAVTPRSTLQNVAEVMKGEDCGIVPVVDENDKLLGVVTDRDIVIRTLAEGKSPFEMAAEDVMTDDVKSVRPDEEIRELVDLLGDRQIRRVPVVDGDERLVGIISMADVANRANYDKDLRAALEKISKKSAFWSQLSS